MALRGLSAEKYMPQIMRRPLSVSPHCEHALSASNLSNTAKHAAQDSLLHNSCGHSLEILRFVVVPHVKLFDFSVGPRDGDLLLGLATVVCI